MDAVEVSYDHTYDDYEVCLLTLDATHANVLLAICLGKTKRLIDATQLGMSAAVDRHIPVRHSRSAAIKAKELYPEMEYVSRAQKLVQSCLDAFHKAKGESP